MNLRTWLGAIALVVVSVLVTSQVVSQDTGTPKKASGTDPTAGMSAEEAAMMKKFIDAGTPGPQHKLLERNVGSWTYTIKHRMDEAAPWEESTGKSESKSLMDGRFFMDDTTGVTPWGPFQGIGINGYDNVSKKFVGVWFANCGTGITFMEGTADPSGKVITYTGTCNCPMEGPGKKGKWVVTQVDNNHFNFDSFATKDGKEWKDMEIRYTRAGTK